MACHVVECAALNNAAFFEHDDMIGKRECIDWIMSDKKGCHWMLTAKS